MVCRALASSSHKRFPEALEWISEESLVLAEERSVTQMRLSKMYVVCMISSIMTLIATLYRRRFPSRFSQVLVHINHATWVRRHKHFDAVGGSFSWRLMMRASDAEVCPATGRGAVWEQSHSLLLRATYGGRMVG